MLDRLAEKRQAGRAPEELALEAGEVIIYIRSALLQWPAEEDANFLDSVTRILLQIARDGREFARLWEEIRMQKQRIADCAGDVDEQLLHLARQTHFAEREIARLREELLRLRSLDGREANGSACLDLHTFTEVVKRAVPDFPPDLCGRLFQKLDSFGVGQLAFVELACGMSALSLGTMDEKLQVCFDLFDSEGRRALTLKNLNDLCNTLFCVALAQGFHAAKKASTDDVLSALVPPRPGWTSPTVAGLSLSLPQASALEAQSATAHPLAAKSRRADSSSRSLASDKAGLFDLPLTPTSARSQASDSWTPNSGRSYASRSTTHIGRQPARTGLQQEELPWRSMLLRLLAAAKVHTPGGPWLVAFDDFRSAAHMEPALLCLFTWCLPRQPEMSDHSFLFQGPSIPGTSWHENNPMVRMCCNICRTVCRWLGR